MEDKKKRYWKRNVLVECVCGYKAKCEVGFPSKEESAEHIRINNCPKCTKVRAVGV